MRPHMAYIENTLIKKKLAEDAADETTSYKRYRQKVDDFIADGVSRERLIDELGNEIARIEKDAREGDPIFQHGVHNAKVACISSIRVIIQELKTEIKGEHK